ncbi:MAG: hypothetical protein ABI678_08255 [Kofleriaceae bacterium]
MPNLRLSIITALAVSTLAACGVSTSDDPTRREVQLAELAAPSPDVTAHAAQLTSCDPQLDSTLQRFVDGVAAVRPEPSASCGGEDPLATTRSASCFTRAWSNMSYTERAACVTVGLPICWTIFCSGLV